MSCFELKVNSDKSCPRLAQLSPLHRHALPYFQRNRHGPTIQTAVAGSQEIKSESNHTHLYHLLHCYPLSGGSKSILENGHPMWFLHLQHDPVSGGWRAINHVHLHLRQLHEISWLRKVHVHFVCV